MTMEMQGSMALLRSLNAAAVTVFCVVQKGEPFPFKS